MGPLLEISWTSEYTNFSTGGKSRHFACPYQVADDAMQMDVHNASPFLHHEQNAQCYDNTCMQCFPLRKFYTGQMFVLVIMNILRLSYRGVDGLYFGFFGSSLLLPPTASRGFLCCSRSWIWLGFWVYWKSATACLLHVLYNYAESNRSRIACVMLIAHPEWTRIENSQNRFESGPKKIRVRTPQWVSRVLN